MENILNRIPVKQKYYVREERFDYVSIIPENTSVEFATLFSKKEVDILNRIDGKRTCANYIEELMIEPSFFKEVIEKLLIASAISFKDSSKINSSIVEIYSNSITVLKDLISKNTILINSDYKIQTDYSKSKIREKMFNRVESFFMCVINEKRVVISLKKGNSSFVVEIGIISFVDCVKNKEEYYYLIQDAIDKVVNYFRNINKISVLKVRINMDRSCFIDIQWENMYVIKDEYGIGMDKIIMEKLYD